MTSKPLHRAGDLAPRAEWPPPTIDDLEPEVEPERYGPVASLLAGLAIGVAAVAAAGLLVVTVALALGR